MNTHSSRSFGKDVVLLRWDLDHDSGTVPTPAHPALPWFTGGLVVPKKIFIF